MTKQRPLILMTNDDGYQAKGLQSLIECIRPYGDLVVVAPDSPRSAMSSALTVAVPIRAKLRHEEEGYRMYSCTGTPVDCVKLALHTLLERKPDIVLSGINHGSNASICVKYSGTLAAASEGCVCGIPSLGISLLDESAEADFAESCRMAQIITQRLLAEGLPNGVYLNLNVPKTEHVKGIRICQQAHARWEQEFLESLTPWGEKVYWLTGRMVALSTPVDEDDIVALDRGYASLVPCRIDVTDRDTMAQLKTWEA